jgi:tRNA modification GTPase
VRETIEIGGLPVTLLDTAGLRESSDPVESIGVERARRAAESSDVVLYLIDAAGGMSEEDRDELRALPDAWIVYSKVDLAPPPQGSVGISVVREHGIDELLARLDQLVREKFVAPEGSLVNERQRIAVAECADALRAAMASIDAGHEEQIIVVDLYRAATALGLLTGVITRDDVFDEIFSKFCIGK